MQNNNSKPKIGTLSEKSLHAGIKKHLTQPGDQVEVPHSGFVIDIVRNQQFIEIQTGNFTAMKRKLKKLLPHHPIQLVYPLIVRRWIVRQTATGETIKRRKSPLHGRPHDIFRELVYIPHFLDHPNLTITLLLIDEEQILRDDGQGSWRRRGWSLHDRQLLTIHEQIHLHRLPAYRRFLPDSLPSPFTTKDLSTTLKCRRDLAQKIAYTLKKAELIAHTGKQGRANLYTIMI
ncbi:MAG TPA: hypothetical protein VLL52_25280 [Anaerolineae bacterium]|nr:hypothetical protein [Anaerolineae bacterium]